MKPSSESLSRRLQRRVWFAQDVGKLALRALRMRLGNAFRAGQGDIPDPQQRETPVADRLMSSEVLRLEDAVRKLPAGHPLASVVIPVYNHCDDTLRCLHALAEVRTHTPYEIIVVDDGSSDQTADALAGLEHVHLLRRERNAGFVAACNAGADVARGRFLVFLNNDTVVADDWLDTLVAVLLEDPDCGLVGSKLIYPDGVLQEAGGIVFSDAQACNYGRGQDPSDPRFNYRREADYCSGASLAIERSLFRDLGGFDGRYAPAYYEDTDLAFAVRARGLKVMYEPRSHVTHYEGRTAGTQPGHGVKRFQERNRHLFREKWCDVLSRQPAASDCIADMAKCADHRSRSRVLVVDAACPRPERDSGSLRMFNMLTLLREAGHHVQFWPTDGDVRGEPACALQRLGIELVHAHTERAALHWMHLHGRELDTVVLSRFGVADRFMHMARRYASGASIVFDTVDLHYLRLERGAELHGDTDALRAASALKRRELELVGAADVTLVVSAFEHEVLKTAVPGAEVRVLGNVHEIHGCRVPFAERRDLVFLGNFEHEPNVDAVRFLAGRIMPLLRTRLPGVTLHVVGYAGRERVGDAGSEDLMVHGFVEDLSSFMDRSRIALGPLRYGAGVKGKVNMAMSYGLPVVATPVAVEGMALRDGEDVLVAVEPEAFADAVARLYTDPDLWMRLSSAGLENVARYFSHDSARHVIDDVFTEA